jgi:hypothetical protein
MQRIPAYGAPQCVYNDANAAGSSSYSGVLQPFSGLGEGYGKDSGRRCRTTRDPTGSKRCRE